MNMKGIKKMAKQKHREMARRLVVRAIEDYKKRFQLEVDILSGEEKRLILEEVEDIELGIKTDREGQYKRKYKETKQRLEHLASLEDCDEEFEI